MKMILYYCYFNLIILVNLLLLVCYMVGLLIVGLLVLFFFIILVAENNFVLQIQQRQIKKIFVLWEKIYKVLFEVQVKLEENKFDEVIKVFDCLKKGFDLNSYEFVMMWKFYVYIYYL